GLYSDDSSAKYSNGPLSSGQARMSSSFGSRVTASVCLAGEEVEDLGGVLAARRLVGGFQVEAQERLGVAGPQVEPPVAVVDGEAGGGTLGRPGRRGRGRLDCPGGVLGPPVDLPGLHVPLVRS